MKVYCSHKNKEFYPKSNYYLCHWCLIGWYKNENVPIVEIGNTDIYEIDKDFQERFAEKDLSKKKFNRCPICKDLIEKRKHIICRIRMFFDSITVGPAPQKIKR